MLIQSAFFSAYFVFSIPASKIIDWIGYKKAIIVGLSTMIVACLAFYPAARIPSFPFFLVALVILATGITIPSGRSESICRSTRKVRKPPPAASI